MTARESFCFCKKKKTIIRAEGFDLGRAKKTTEKKEKDTGFARKPNPFSEGKKGVRIGYFLD